MSDELENQVEQTEEQQEEEEHLFTQAEVDALIGKRLAKERKGQPDAEELKQFRAWKATQTPKEEKEDRSELDAALVDMEMTRRENYLLRQGIDPDDVDYYVYKISKSMDGETDFEDAAKDFLKNKKPKSAVRVDTGARLHGGDSKRSVNDQMNDLIRNSKH